MLRGYGFCIFKLHSCFLRQPSRTIIAKIADRKNRHIHVRKAVLMSEPHKPELAVVIKTYVITDESATTIQLNVQSRPVHLDTFVSKTKKVTAAQAVTSKLFRNTLAL